MTGVLDLEISEVKMHIAYATYTFAKIQKEN